MLEGPAYHPKAERDNMIPVFYMKAVRNNFESQKQGRDIWDEIPYVEIMIPGDKLTQVHERVNEGHKHRWPTHWMAFQMNQEAPQEGTPLAEWPPCNRAMLEMLGSQKVRTVEQLAGLSDAQLMATMPMGGRVLRDKAQAWLKQAEGMAPMAEMQQQLEASRDEIENLKRQIAELATAKVREKADD
jgi:hypothetical protein